MKHSAGLVLVAALLAVGACGGNDEGAGGLTPEDSRQLNEAAEMLDASPDSLAVPDETGLGNGANSADTGALPVTDEAATNAQ